MVSVTLDYIFDIFIDYIFTIDYNFVVLYLSILSYYTCFACFIDLWTAKTCCLCHNDTDNANEITFSLLYTPLAIISISNSS